MTVAITVVTQSLPLFADGTGGGERGVLGDVTNLNRPLAARLSCGSTNDFLLPGPAATAITNIDNKANMHKGRASLATASKPSSRPAATSCPVVACSLLRPAADGTYGNVSWSAMDQGGAILYNQQQDITKTGSMTYQRLLSDGMGVARLKDSPVETEKVSQNSLQHNTGNGSKVKENKVLPSDRGLAEADIEDADLYAASWTTATGYAVSNMLSADSNFPGKLLARWSKQQDALNADGQPRSSVGGPKCCVPPILTPNDAAQHFRNLGADTYWPRSKRTEGTKAAYRAAAKLQDVKFSGMRPHLRKIQDVLDIDVNYEYNYHNAAVIPSLTSRMALELQACSEDEKDSVEAIWLHAIYGMLAHQGSSWSEIGAMMADLGEVAVKPDLSKLKNAKPTPKVKVEPLAKNVEAAAEQEQMDDEEDADEEPPPAGQRKQPVEAGKKAMSMADQLIAAVKGGKGGKGKKAGQEKRGEEQKGKKRKEEQMPKGKGKKKQRL
ncbi:hypothetical protein HYH02_015270 [Chlamydomonas schloesseri]|uniref:Uncharacterized protein n=1 Tax=Chlamydomonas schloesseri TaxID=2026947 RepID=A0A835VNZ8_9CHLO|nr:hypothetical protein HYH02_015270 [Chlamydomonas schloesseri]|eukprot:KAG2423867.1 hypothetical protein HYH02_015270 [Chlamydomonas schloesseri]